MQPLNQIKPNPQPNTLTLARTERRHPTAAATAKRGERERRVMRRVVGRVVRRAVGRVGVGVGVAVVRAVHSGERIGVCVCAERAHHLRRRQR
jgi:hypothetical protein